MEVEIRTPLMPRENAMYFIGCLIDRAQLDSHDGRTHCEEFASRGQKYQTCLILSSRPREANFSPKFPRTREETAEQNASRGSLLSSYLTV